MLQQATQHVCTEIIANIGGEGDSFVASPPGLCSWGYTLTMVFLMKTAKLAKYDAFNKELSLISQPTQPAGPRCLSHPPVTGWSTNV